MSKLSVPGGIHLLRSADQRKGLSWAHRAGPVNSKVKSRNVDILKMAENFNISDNFQIAGAPLLKR